MPTPKKTDSKTVAKEAPAPKKKTCGKSACKTAVEQEAPARKKCCRKKAAEPEKSRQARQKGRCPRGCCGKEDGTENGPEGPGQKKSLPPPPPRLPLPQRMN